MLTPDSFSSRQQTFADDLSFAKDCFSAASRQLFSVLMQRYRDIYFDPNTTRDSNARRKANLFALRTRSSLCPKGMLLRPNWTVEERIQKAVELPREVLSRLAGIPENPTPEVVLQRVMPLLNRYGVYLRGDTHAPWFAKTIPTPANDKSALNSFVKKITSDQFWRHAIKTMVMPLAESHRRNLGLVSKSSGLYVSDEYFAEFLQSRARTKSFLEDLVATNELGESVSVADLAQSSASNPVIARTEVMVRCSGMEKISKNLGYVPLFVTLTCASCFHAMKLIGKNKAIPNPKFNGSTPIDAHKSLTASYALFRTAIHRRGIHIFGLRVVEPHHDGTPHWHLLLYVRPEHVEIISELFNDFFTRAHREELINKRTGKLKLCRRVKIKKLDASRSATGYIAKYIAKNIDGYGANGESIGMNFDGMDAPSAALRVKGWASLWNQRQFQFLGMASITIYRESRRIANHDGSEFDSPSLGSVITAADQGDWEAYEYAMGFAKPRRQRAVTISYAPETVNRYGESAKGKVIGIVDCRDGIFVRSRIHTWTIEHRAVSGRSAATGQLGILAITVSAPPEQHYNKRPPHRHDEAIFPQIDSAPPPLWAHSPPRYSHGSVRPS